MMIGRGQRLLFRVSERGNKAPCLGSIRVRNLDSDNTRKLQIRHLPDPAADHRPGLAQRLEPVLPDAFLLQGTKEALDKSVLLRGVHCCWARSDRRPGW